MKRIAPLFAALLMATACLAADRAPLTTVIIVRHAEKTGAGDDAPLSPKGKQRAKELARVLADAGVEKIYVVQGVPRTAQTAEPLAAALRITPTPMPNLDVKSLAADIRAAGRGKKLLVISRTNMIPRLVEQLGVASPPTIPEDQYDDLFVCTITDEVQQPHLLRLRYGEPAHSGDQKKAMK
jgi:phosphohistidine phosphatase SixA